ncbi:hypothetical protein SMGD1_0682 [Sulfurimonas gotlandica GD1]|uniref:Uncharacterized protein n=1 Tax=Sulfurimonas gotlandica (strain DSM 19862 / JCM 16533 / GD1) TaxID=929558 RepID=B6BKZ5_SULGG|nr:hypothetical protein [Sulfurimonas gotlandica]EDZ62388.1 hypothetical protein CBGD1_304 [Sulfurimonas gotlandica GD1]EHP29209.1 hypothetical protein SMGD1_0682 [Sulfurimonas gotlandica GD1]
MEHIQIGMIAFSAFTTLVLFLVVDLTFGRRYHEEDEAKKKAEFKKSFLKVKQL